MSSLRASIVVAVVLVAGALLLAADASSERQGLLATNPVVTENALPGVDRASWLPRHVPPTRIEGYASETSVLPGDTVHFHVSTADGDRYRIEVYRLGWYGGAGARLLTCIPSCGSDQPGRKFGGPQHDPVTGVARAAWPVTDSLAVPAGWISGYYHAVLRLTEGGDDTGVIGYVPFVVRAPLGTRSQILVQVPINTWQAYNPWGGKSLYPSNSSDHAPALRVSFDRPLAFTAQGPFDWEYNLVRFLEGEGYDVSYQTDLDTHSDPASLLRHRLVIVDGHDEYWTKEMRDAFDTARARSTNLAFMNSNAAYWQVRYEDGGRTIVGYKEAAPDPEPNPALRTIKFRDLTPARPECALQGVMYYRIRESVGAPVDYTVTEAARGDAWLAGTGLAPGDKILDVVGNEWDASPESPVPAGCTKPGLKVLLHYEGPPQNADAVRYTAQSGARIFAGGAQQLAWTLDPFNTDRFGRTLPADQRMRQFVRNVFADLGRPAVPRGLEATVTGRRVTLRILPRADPRISSHTIVRHKGPGRFALTAQGVARVCQTTELTCVNRNVPRGTWRYAVFAEDPWARSPHVLSQRVVVSPPPS